jgi:hypothetical protein
VHTRLVPHMAVTIMQLLSEKWEAQLEILENVDNSSPLPRESTDVHDDADVATLKRLPNQLSDTCDCKSASCDACLSTS